MFSVVSTAAVALQHFPPHLHEEGVAIVHRVAQLEGKDGVGATAMKLLSQLVGGEPVLVEAIVPGNPP